MKEKIFLQHKNYFLKTWIVLFMTFGICKGYSQTPNGFYYNQEFLIDFGELENTSGNWNNITTLNSNYTLMSSSGSSSSISIEMTEGIKGQNETNGSGITINRGALADASLTSELGNLAENSATKDYFYHSSTGQITVNFEGLDINNEYQLLIFATRTSASERITQYTLNGSTTVNGDLQTSGAGIGVTDHINGNVSLLRLETLKPNSDGQLVLTATSTTFCYLGALRLVEFSPITPNNSFLVDFGNTEISSPDANGNYWNNKNYSYQPLNNIIDSEGNTSDYDMTVTSGWGVSSSGGVNDASTTLYTDLLSENNATSDYSFVSGSGGVSPNDLTILISGLSINNAYRFKILSSRNINIDQTNEFKFEGDISSSINIMSSTLSDGPNLKAYYSDFLQPNASGEILITVSSSDINGQLVLNALEIDEYEYLYASQEFLIDFGNLESTNSPDVNGSYWNNIENLNTPINLNGINNTISDYTLELTNGGFGSNGGLTDPLLSEGISSLAIESATTDYCYAKEGLSDSVCVTLSNLNSQKGYRFNCYATRKDINEERITNYEFIGSNTVTGQLQTTGSTLGTSEHLYGNLHLFSSSLVFPDNEGKIIIKAKRESGTEFCYLGALRIEEYNAHPGVDDLMYVPTDDSYNFFSLPVSLIYFEAKIEEMKVTLKWSTASEINNDYFLIEHSINGLEWNLIDKVQGYGNSNTIVDYETIDNTPSEGQNFYRLIQVDLDGSQTYFEKQEVYINLNHNTPTINIFPNPIKNHSNLFVSISSLKTGTVSIELLDISGKLKMKESLSVESSFINMKLSTDKPGIYLLRIKQHQLLIVKKIIIH